MKSLEVMKTLSQNLRIEKTEHSIALECRCLVSVNEETMNKYLQTLDLNSSEGFYKVESRYYLRHKGVSLEFTRDEFKGLVDYISSI